MKKETMGAVNQIHSHQIFFAYASVSTKEIDSPNRTKGKDLGKLKGNNTVTTGASKDQPSLLRAE